MTLFEQHFWGEKNNGFSVLYHNMKHGLDSSKEFEEFLRESCKVEENYCQQQGKLAKSAGGNCTSRGSFAPFWQVLKTLVEKLSNIHQQLMLSWQELIREVHKHNNDQQKRHKEVKEQEAGTLEAVQTIQQTISSLNRAKETYHARCMEFEKLKRDRAAQKDVERAENRAKRAHDEYNTLIEKYTNNRNEFEVSMTESCKRFQEMEEKHLQQMKDFVDAYAKSWENQHAMLGQIYSEFKHSTENLTVDTLMEAFIKNKGTGSDKPGPLSFRDSETQAEYAGAIEFISPDLSVLPPTSTPPDTERRESAMADKTKQPAQSDNISQGSSASDNNVPAPKTSVVGSERTLVIRGLFPRPKKDKKPKKHVQGKEKDETDAPDKNVPQVDDEGYIIRPDNPAPNCNHQSSDSSSDSDSDADDKRTKKLNVAIRPLTPSRGVSFDNVDDIRSVAINLRLSPTAIRRTPVNDNFMKNSTSATSSLSGMGTASKLNEDLIDLDLFGPANTTSFSIGSANSPMNGEKDAASGIKTPTARDSVDSISSSSLDDSITSISQRHKVPTPTNPGLPPLIIGPVAPLRTSRTTLPNIAMARPAGRQTPDPFRSERSDSVPQMNSSVSGSSLYFGTSRGPSPLTIGFSDTIPLAVAFSETVHAYFHGSDASKCQVMLTGSMVVSFPAGIVRVLTENSNPNPLSFRIKNTANVREFFFNKQLIVEDDSQTSAVSRAYSFNMAMLIDHLRNQAEQNKSASYFNIDIIKYNIKSQPGIQSVPLHLVSTWSCDAQQINFELNYSYNSAALTQPCPLNNVSVVLPVDGPVLRLQSQPTGSWSEENKRATWKLGDIVGSSENGGQGSLIAAFELSPESTVALPSLAAAQFSIEGTTLSGVDFEIAGSGYRMSLLKKRVATGKYVSGID